MGKKVIKNKEIPVEMLVGNVMNPKIVQGIAIVTNDEKRKDINSFAWLVSNDHSI